MSNHKKYVLGMPILLAVALLLAFIPAKKVFATPAEYDIQIAYAEYDQSGVLRPAGSFISQGNTRMDYNTSSYVLTWDSNQVGTITSSNDGRKYSAIIGYPGRYVNRIASYALVPGIRAWNNKSAPVSYSAQERNFENGKNFVTTGIPSVAYALIALDSEELPKPTVLRLTSYNLPDNYELDSTYYSHHNFEEETSVSLTAQKLASIKHRMDAYQHVGDNIAIVLKQKGTPSYYGKARSMYRLYNKNSGEHFYTASVGERNSLVKAGWRYEGVAWNSPTTSDVPVYRLYNKNSGDHHYTISASERNSLIRAGWRDEGIGWYAGGSYAVYRQYNPNAKTGSHNFTTSKVENDNLVKVGWKAEGIAWYAG